MGLWRFMAAGLGIAVCAIWGRCDPKLKAVSGRASLPGLTLILFWCVSFAVWAGLFGIQRYAVLLEVLAVPIIGAGAYLAVPRFTRSIAMVPALVLLAAMLGQTTQIADFGRRPMQATPIIPSETIEPLTRLPGDPGRVGPALLPARGVPGMLPEHGSRFGRAVLLIRPTRPWRSRRSQAGRSE